MPLTLPANVTIDPGAIPGMTLNLQSIAADSRLRQLVNAQPFQTIAAKPPKESDMTNLMLIGSAEQLAASFSAAGWFPAIALSKLSAFEAFTALAEMRGY